MASAVLRKSVTDLTRRKASTVFAVLTLAIAVASVGIFAAPSLMDQAMQQEVRSNELPDVTLSTNPLSLTDAQVAAIGRLPNVEAAQAVSSSRRACGSARGVRRPSSLAFRGSRTSRSTSSPSPTASLRDRPPS